MNPILQTNARPDAKPSYGFVSSVNIIEQFEAKGWHVESTKITKTRDPNGQSYAKHLVWLRNDNYGPLQGLTKNNESSPRLCLVNSHDSSSSVMIFLGVMRIACLNQLATGNVFRFFRAVHSKNVTGKVAQGIDYVTDGIPELTLGIQKLQSIQLTKEQRILLATRIINLRLAKVPNILSIDYEVVDRCLRLEDTYQDAYTVLNRLQEYVIKGGVPYSYERIVKNDDGIEIERNLVHTKTRALQSIPSQLKLNKALFESVLKVS